MKKILVVILSVTTALVSGLFLVSHSNAEESTQDQYCAPGPETEYEMLGAGGVVRSQTFEPAKNRLTEIDIKIGGLNLNGGTPITLTLYGPGFDGPEIASKTIMPTIGVPSVRSWTLSSPVTVTSGSVYKFILSTTGPGSVYWYYGVGDQTCDGNDRTYGFHDSTHQLWDWNYKTLGYNVSAPAGEGAPSDSGTTGSTGSTLSGETFGTTTTSIAKPTNLTAAYSDSDRGVKLAWKASGTAAIDGYKVFRSESQNSGYTKVATTIKDKLEAIDQQVVGGKTYYYQVRAYKGDSQSVSSNTASVSVPTDIAPAKPINFKVVDSTFNMITVMWRKSTDTKLAGYTINLYKGKDKIRSAEISAEFNNYSFFELDSGTLYKVELIAKNAKGQTSSPAIAFGLTELPESIENLIDATKAVAAAVVLLLLLILVINTVKHYKKK